MFAFYAAAFLTLGAFVAAGTLMGGGSSGSRDYNLGGRSSSSAGVAGILLGALVGGASTVGTVQMAYSSGMTAVWFTLGGGIGCLLLGLRFAVPVRNSGITTVADYLAGSYGGRDSFYGSAVSFTATISSSVGTFISICAQFLSCIAMLRGIFPLSAWSAALLAALSVLGFIAAGGMKSYSTLGKAKILLLYIVLLICVGGTFYRGNTFASVASALPLHPWFNPFGRGFFTELGYLASMVVGVFTTQIYIQSLAAAKDARTARNGAFASAVLMPPMGLLGTWIGLSVRARGIDMLPEKVLPWFIMDTFPPVIGGLIWGGILITVIGCAAGLILGISTNIAKNLIPRSFMERHRDCEITVQRGLAGAIVALAAISGVGGAGSMILEWSYLSMGLRGAGTFLPFVIAVLRPGALSPAWALASSAGGLAGTLGWVFTGSPGDPLFAGLFVSGVCVVCGMIRKPR
ncbi:MAG: sodium:solute symporter family protein [Synergistaceae bacterium]|nr:sodium:solute symporter family protein [Synergistaceae bacterium]